LLTSDAATPSEREKLLWRIGITIAGFVLIKCFFCRWACGLRKKANAIRGRFQYRYLRLNLYVLIDMNMLATVDFVGFLTPFSIFGSGIGGKKG
jgi:hypothetical protein